MKTRCKLRPVAAALLAILLLTSVASPVFAEGDGTGRTVRVGCVDIANFLSVSNGAAVGYGADYLREISYYTGWTYEYISGTWSECLRWLSDGEIDLLLPAEYSEERAENFLFSSIECCIDFVVLLSLDDSGLYYEDFADYDMISVGMIRGNYLNDCFGQYALDNGFTYDAVYFETGAELSAALAGGAVDAVVTGNLDLDPNTKILAKFDYMPAYFITGKDNADLMRELDDAMYRINLENPYFTSGLYDTYYAPYVSQSKVFTREESEYVAGSKPLRVVCDSDNYPFEWYDEASGVYRGIDVDILGLIAENSGLTLEFVRTDSLLRSWELIREGEADIIAGVYLDETLSLDYGADATASYTDEISNAVCRRNETPALSDIRTVALRESFVGTAKYLGTYYPDWTIITYPDADGCLKAVADGAADITFIGSFRLQTETVLDDYPELSILTGVTVAVPISLGVSSDESPLLRSVLNKSIRAVSQNEKQQIIANNTVALSQIVTLASIIREHPVAVVLAVAIILMTVACCVFLAYHSNMQKKYAVSLTEKNEELSRANKTTSSFFSQLIHDMRTPMNAVLSFSEFGLESRTVDEASEYFKKIRSSGQYLLNLINDTLEISKMSTGKLELRLEPCLSSELISALTNLLQTKADEKGVSLEMTDGSVDASAALFDRTHLQQIFMNLINNAIKFTPRGGSVRLQILRVTEGERPAVRFTVSDTGIGMSREFIEEKLYRPFEQENRAGSGFEMGTGLGLVIVKSLVDLMEGTIVCESEPGKGTSFTVVIPTSFVLAAHEAPIEPKADDPILNGKRVLLCEDQAINREIIIKLLGKRNVSVDSAANGKEGLDMFVCSAAGCYDAILMDIRMPEMDGLEAARAIRALERPDASTVPIIAISANAFAEDANKSLEAGMNAHISKPVDPQRLYDVLSEQIRSEVGRK